MWVEGGNRGAELMGMTKGMVKCTLLCNFHRLHQLTNSNYCDFQHFSVLMSYSLLLLQLWNFYQDCSWLQTCAGLFFERETCSSFMAARSEGTLRCVQHIPKEKDAFFSLWSTSHYLSYPNVITICWSR